MVTIKVKKLNENAVIPSKANITDAGLDLTCVDISTEVGEDAVVSFVYHTGLALEIPEGYMGLIFPRSSIAKKSLLMTNCVGVIDAGYRGEIMAKMKVNTTSIPSIYRPTEKFAQLVIMPIPEVTLELTEELAASDRGEGGYGSSDLKHDIDTVMENTSEQTNTEA